MLTVYGFNSNEDNKVFKCKDTDEAFNKFTELFKSYDYVDMSNEEGKILLENKKQLNRR